VSQINGQTWRRRLAVVFEDEEPRNATTRLFNWALALLIVANVSCVVLESVEPIRRHFAVAFDLFEQVATAIFAVEYVFASGHRFATLVTMTEPSLPMVPATWTCIVSALA
jgi:hypothetical protein